MGSRFQRQITITVLLTGFLGSMVTLPAAAQVDPPSLFEEVFAFRSSDTNERLPPVQFNAIAWGDYDGDGDFDLFVTGNLGVFGQPVPFTQLYLNNGDTSTQIFDPDAFMGFRNIPITVYADAVNVDLTVLVDIWLGAVAWGDYDNDGDLDVLTTGIDGTGAYTSDLYENIPEVGFPPERFTRPFSWPGVHDGAVAWADYDNDGDLDFVLAGTDEGGLAVTTLYENQVRTDGGFVRRDDANLIGLHSASLAWGDYDNDGDHDLLVTGVAEPQAFVTRLYRNDNGFFADAQADLKGLLFASAAWGDYDADGDLDILLTGAKLHPFLLQGEIKVYENNGGTFTDDTVMLEGIFEGAATLGRYQGSAGWGDFNNDGFLDFFVAGIEEPAGAPQGQVYRYTGGNRFASTGPGNPPAYLTGRFLGGFFSSTFWADYDSDNDLDLFVLLERSEGGKQLMTLRNYLPFFPPNTPPSSPVGLAATPQGNSVTLRWQAAQDAQTPAPGLSYNLRVGTTPGGVEVLSPMALPATGHRLVAALGNAGLNLEWTLRDLPSGTYFWSVQAIDNSYKGSPFAPEGTFTIP